MPTVRVIPPVVPDAAALRVAAYCRVSRDSEDQLESYAAQVRHYTEIIGAHEDWLCAGIYADEGLTGTRADTRPDFQRLLRDCRRGKIDRILIKSISRLARNTRDCLAAVRELKALGVEVYFEKERLDTAHYAGEMLLSFHGAQSQEESLSISGNMRWSYRHRMQSGEFITCRAPYGYRLAGKTLVIQADEAVIVRQVFAEFLAGRSAADIAAALVAEGVAKWHGHWNHKAVMVLLNNEKYCGNVLLGKRYTTETLPFREVRNHGERDQVFVRHSHPPIVSEETFEQAQALLRARRVPGSPRRTYPFSRKITCGICGKRFKRKVCNGKTYWVCRNHFDNKDNCPIRQTPEPLLEDAFTRLWNKLRTHRREILILMLEQLEALRSGRSRHNARIGEIDLETVELMERSRVLNSLRAKGYMDSVLFVEQSNTLERRVGALRTERRLLLTDDDDQTIDRVRELLDMMDSGPEVLTDFDPDLFGNIIGHVVILSRTEAKFKLICGLELSERL